MEVREAGNSVVMSISLLSAKIHAFAIFFGMISVKGGDLLAKKISKLYNRLTTIESTGKTALIAPCAIWL